MDQESRQANPTTKKAMQTKVKKYRSMCSCCCTPAQYRGSPLRAQGRSLQQTEGPVAGERKLRGAPRCILARTASAASSAHAMLTNPPPRPTPPSPDPALLQRRELTGDGSGKKKKGDGMKDRLLANEQTLASTSEQLRNAARVIAETEEVGKSTLGAMEGQRRQLENAADTVGTTRRATDKAKTILQRMGGSAVL